MNFRRYISTFLLSCIILLSSGCFKKQHYPVQPVLSYKDFIIAGDSAILMINFTDGDGDIGLGDEEVDAPYDFGSDYYYNFIVEYYEKDDQLGWTPGLDLNGDSIVFQYRIHPFTNLKKKDALKGIIETTIEPIYYNPFSAQNDTIRYRVRLIDRALNKSEWVETSEITR